MENMNSSMGGGSKKSSPVLVIVLIIVIALIAWFVFGKKGITPDATTPPVSTNQGAEAVAPSARCQAATNFASAHYPAYNMITTSWSNTAYNGPQIVMFDGVPSNIDTNSGLLSPTQSTGYFAIGTANPSGWPTIGDHTLVVRTICSVAGNNWAGFNPYSTTDYTWVDSAPFTVTVPGVGTKTPPPTVTVTAPTGFYVPASAQKITATATGGSNTIKAVNIYVDGWKVGSCTKSPCQANFNPKTYGGNTNKNGFHIIMVSATDSVGATGYTLKGVRFQ